LNFDPSWVQVEIRRLNRNYNHDLKNLFKGAAIVAATKPGPFAEFYAELLAKGMRQEMARLTLAPSSGGDRSHRIDVLVSAVAGGTGH